MKFLKSAFVQKCERAPSRSLSLRLRGKLLLAFLSISFLTVAAVGIGLVSFQSVRSGFSSLADRDLPNITLAAGLGVKSTDLAISASKLFHATDDGARSSANADLQSITA
ncbi:MAG: hypothetical protein AAFW76_12285, partial [Pseudomonadota bacterium]